MDKSKSGESGGDLKPVPSSSQQQPPPILLSQSASCSNNKLIIKKNKKKMFKNASLLRHISTGGGKSNCSNSGLFSSGLVNPKTFGSSSKDVKKKNEEEISEVIWVVGGSQVRW